MLPGFFLPLPGQFISADKIKTGELFLFCPDYLIGGWLHRSDPDVAERNRFARVAMILQLDW